MASPLDRSAKEDILREIAGIPLAIEEVARGQTRLPRAKGTRPESEGEERCCMLQNTSYHTHQAARVSGDRPLLFVGQRLAEQS